MLRLKRSMSNFDIAVLLGEIGQLVIGAWINNIYQIKEVFLFKLNTRSGDKTLLVEPGYRVHLTKFVRGIPKTPSNFCAALRRHIRNGHVENIVQYDLDRIVTIAINTHSKTYKLVIELFREGNLILCDAEDRIVLARRYRMMRDRSVKPKEILTPPPPRGTDLASLSENDVISILNSSSSGLAETLASRLNIDPLYAEEICSVSNLGKDRKSKELSTEEKLRIAQAIQLTVNKLRSGPYEPQIIVAASGKPLATAPFHLAVYENLSAKRMESYNDALDEFFSTTEASATTGLELKEHEREIEEVDNTIKEQRKRIEELDKLETDNRKFGDLIYSNLPQVDEILSVVRSARRKGVSWKDIENKLIEAKKGGVALADRISSLDSNEGTITLDLSVEKVPTDVRLSATENAARFYDAAKKAESKKRGAQSALQTALGRLKGLKTEQASVKEEALRTKRQKKWYERYRWFISSDGFLVIGGRDARTNEMIVKKRLEPTDVFVHADVHGAPVVIVKSAGKDVPETTIVEACQFSVAYSKLWKLGVGAGDAYWAKGEQVSLSPPSGEYLQKGSFMVRGQRNYVKGVPLRISIGLVIDEEKNVIPVAGPPSSVAKKTGIRVELSPGEEAGAKLVHSIRYKLMKLAAPDLELEIEEIPVDEFLLILPSGAGSIVGQ